MFAEGDQFLAYVVQPDSSVMRANLRLGRRLADRVEVLEGVEAGAVVVRAGHQKLFPGAKVAPVSFGPPPAGPPAAAEPPAEEGIETVAAEEAS